MKKASIWLCICLLFVSRLYSVDHITEQTREATAIVIVADTTSPTIKQRILGLYEKIKHLIQDCYQTPSHQEAQEQKSEIRKKIFSLLCSRKITASEINFLRNNERILTKLSDKGTGIFIQGIGNLAESHHESSAVAQCPMEVKVDRQAMDVAGDIITNLSAFFVSALKALSDEHHTVVNKISSNISHAKSDVEYAFKKALTQCFTPQELCELRTFVISSAFKALINNVGMFKDIFFKNLSPEILSKLQALV